MAQGHITVTGCSAGVSAVAATFSGLIASRATTPLSQNPWFIACLVIAIVAFLVLIVTSGHAAYAYFVSKGRNQRRKRMKAEADAEAETAQHFASLGQLSVIKVADGADIPVAISMEGEDSSIDQIGVDVPHGVGGIRDRGRRNKITRTDVRIRDPKEDGTET